MKAIIILSCILGFGWCLWSCEKSSSYPDVPEIHFKSLSFDSIASGLGVDLKAVLTMSFIDGNGDIGVRSAYDSISKIHYTWYEKTVGGNYEPYRFNTGIGDSTVIPYGNVMDREEAQNKILKGTIKLLLDAPYKPQNIDSMRIGFYIADRAGNKSNIEYTPDFSILNTSAKY